MLLGLNQLNSDLFLGEIIVWKFSILLLLIICLQERFLFFVAIPNKYPNTKPTKHNQNEKHHRYSNYLTYFFFIFVFYEHILAFLPSLNSELGNYHPRATLILAFLLCEGYWLTSTTIKYIPIIITICLCAVMKSLVVKAECAFIGVLSR